MFTIYHVHNEIHYKLSKNDKVHNSFIKFLIKKYSINILLLFLEYFVNIFLFEYIFELQI